MIHFFEREFKIGPQRGGPVTDFKQVIEVRRPEPSRNASAILALQGFDFRFTNADHKMLRAFVRPELDGPGPFIDSVPIRIDAGMRDSSGNWDDQYEVSVRIGIIVVDDDRVDVFERTQEIPESREPGPQARNAVLQLNAPSTTGITFLRGFDIGFERKDHKVFELLADVDDQTFDLFDSRFDTVRCRLGLRDSSGFWDDPYSGTVLFSSLRFPLGAYGVETGFRTVVAVNQGPAEGTTDHFIQQEVSRDRLFVGLTGFETRYVDNDHKIHQLISRVEMKDPALQPARTTIQVNYAGGVRDRSGNWDDPYSNTGRYAILAVTGQNGE